MPWDKAGPRYDFIDRMQAGMQASETVDDFQLVTAWRDGDAAARERLFARHYARIHRFFDVKVPGASDDLTQQTFLSCLELVRKLEEPSSFSAFLFGIARNLLLRYLRSAGRDGARRVPYQTAAGERTSPSGILARSEEQWLILRAMEKLPTDLRIALELFYWEGMKSSEIATVLRMPVSTVTTRISRARSRLQRAVAELSTRAALDESEIETWTKSLADATDEAPPKTR